MKTILKSKFEYDVFVKIQEVDRNMVFDKNTVFGQALIIKNGYCLKSNLFCICSNQNSLHVAYRIPYANEIFRLSLAIIHDKIGE